MKPDRCLRCRSLNHGFTLVELMTTMGVVFVVMLFCGVLMNMGTQQQRSARNSLDWDRKAAFFVEGLSEDLASAHGPVWHQSGDEKSCEVGWLMLVPSRAQCPDEAVGDLCAVGYGLVNRELDPGSGLVQQCLMRQVHDSRQVLSLVEAGNLDRVWLWGERSESVLEGVVNFEIWPMLKDGPDRWRPWHPGLRDMPEAVELRVLLASSSLLNRLRTAEDWDRARFNVESLPPEEIQELRTLIHLGVNGS